MSQRCRALSVVCSCLIAAFIALSHAQNASQPVVLLQGRFFPGPQNGSSSTLLPQNISWAASSLFTTFRGANTVTVDITASPQTNVSYSINWFRFFIDGAAVGDGFTSYKAMHTVVTIPVDSGQHTLRVAKISDPAKGEATINSITIDTGNYITSVPPSLSLNRSILILGDSYSVGYGDAGAAIPNTCQPTYAQMSPDLRQICQAVQIPDNECPGYVQILNGNALAAFGPLVANAFSADYQLIATSGSGMVGFSYGIDQYPNWNLAQIMSLLPSSQMLFNRTLYSNPNLIYNFNSWMPQVVVVASGTNDWHSSPPEYSLSAWLDMATAFLQQISNTFNQPVIIVQQWSQDTQSQNVANTGGDQSQVAEYMTAMPALVQQATAKGVKNLYLLGLTASDYNDQSSWCDGHPSAVAQQSVANQLVAEIQKLVPAWNVTNPINGTINQEALRPSVALLGSRVPAAG